MIARINAQKARQLDRLFARFPVESVRIAGLLDAYGTGHAFLSTYTQNDDQALLTQIDDTFLLFEPLPSRADDAELSEFLRWSPHFSRLLGTFPSLERLRGLLPDGTLQNHIRMSACSAPKASVFPQPFSMERGPKLPEVFALLNPTAPGGFAAWYADLSHRIRHRCARAYLAKYGGVAVSACLVSIESRYAGLISNVFTSTEWRGRGLATAVVAAATADLAAAGRLAVLECSLHLCPFYLRLGYTRYDETGTLTVHAAQDGSLSRGFPAGSPGMG